jgi:hypothetical protein
MKKTLSIIICTILLSSCEMIVITNKKNVISRDISQNSPLGAIYLFKTELDSNNISAATQTLATPEGGRYLAIDRYDMYDEIARIKRIIDKMPVTAERSDSLSVNSYRFQVEFDYLRKFSFTTAKIDSYWYIIRYDQIN